MMTQRRTKYTLIIEMKCPEPGHAHQVVIITKIPEKKIGKTKLGTKALMYLVKLM